MSTTRTVTARHGDENAARRLDVTRYGMDVRSGGLGLQLGIGGEYVQLTREEREQLRITLGELFPDEGWIGLNPDPLAPPAQPPLLARWHELVKRVPNDTNIEMPVDVLREALRLRRECEQVTSEDPSYGTALWIAGRIRAEITLEDEPRSLVDQLAAAGNAAARGSLTVMPQDEVLGPVTVHPLTRDQVLEFARAHWQDPVGFYDAVLAHMGVTDEEEYEPVTRGTLDLLLDDVLEHSEGAADHIAVRRLRKLFERVAS